MSDFNPVSKLILFAALLATASVLSSQLHAADSGKVLVTVPMVRVEVSTTNPAVNQRYDLEIDSFDGQSIRGFEPEKVDGAVRALISINMNSVLSLKFYSNTYERAQPRPIDKAHDTPAGRPEVGSGPSDSPAPGGTETGTQGGPIKDLAHKLEKAEGELNDLQFDRILTQVKNPADYKRLKEKTEDSLLKADSSDHAKQQIKTLVLIEMMHASYEEATKFDSYTARDYFKNLPIVSRDVERTVRSTAERIVDTDLRNASLETLNSTDLRLWTIPIGRRVWNEVHPDRAIDEFAPKHPGEKGKPGMRGRPGAGVGRPIDTPPQQP